MGLEIGRRSPPKPAQGMILRTVSHAIAPGYAAELVLYDPDATTTFTKEFMHSKSINTPFFNKTLQGQVRLVMVGQKILLER